MFSVKSAAVISTCSIGIGILIGRKSSNVNLPSKDKNSYFSSENFYVFPTAAAKTLVVPNILELLLVQEDNDNGVNDKKETTTRPDQQALETAKYGFPSFENLRSYDDFILSYDKRNRNANWVLEHLTPEKVDKSNADRSKMKFVEDKSFHVFHRSTNKDFQGSGYDRGHLAAAGNHRHSPSAMAQTFLLSNVAPQVGEGFNRNAWNNLEKYTRAVARRNKNVYVCTGPLYLPRVEANGKMFVKYEVIGANHVAVPTHFFKILLIENEKGEKEVQSFVLPNQPLPDVKLKHYLIPIETIERAAGLHFFDKVKKTMLKRINTIEGS